MTQPLDRRPVREKASPWPFVGMSGLAAELFLYGASVLFLPWWGVALLVVVWLVLLLVGLRWFSTRPRRMVVLPAVGFVVWLGAVALAVMAAG